jgi:hypothetical protein
MSMAGDALPLRPLSIGEIFDRAVTLYVRHFVLLTLIMLVVLLPLTILTYFSTVGSTSYQQILQQATHPERSPSPSSIASLLQFEGVLMLVVVLQLFLMPFANVAIAAAVAALYRAERPNWRGCYAVALRRWPAMLGTAFMEIVILGSVAFAGAFAFGLMVVIGVIVTRGSVAAAVVLGIVAVVLMVAWFLAMFLCAIALGFAFNAIGIEGAPAFTAIGLGFARIFNRRELSRASLVVVAIGAIYVGIYLVIFALFGLIQTVTHSFALVEIANVPISLLSATFIALLFAVYYFDVRVRREGLDMQAALDRLE